MAAVTNCHKYGSLKITHLFSYRSKTDFIGVKSRCKWVWLLMEALEENLFPCVLQLMIYILWISCLIACSSIFKISNIQLQVSLCLHCCHMACSVFYSLILLCLPLIRKLVVTFRAHPNNTRWFSYLKIINLTTPTKPF